MFSRFVIPGERTGLESRRVANIVYLEPKTRP
jgi:hypothetical protein